MVSSYYTSYSSETLRRLGELAHESSVKVGQELTGKLAKGYGKHTPLGGGSSISFGGDIAEISDYRKLEELILADRHDVSPLARAIACLCALSRLETAAFAGHEAEGLFGLSGVAGATLTHDQVQHQLSRLLVDFPVLLDPHLRVRTTRSGDYRLSRTIASEIALLTNVSLPRLEHGISEEELRRFAAHPCVFDGLRARGTYESDSTPLLLATDTVNYPDDAPGVVRGAFVASMVELDRLCREETGQNLLREATLLQGSQRMCAAALLRTVAYAFWEAAAGGHRSGLTRNELVKLLTTPTASLVLRDADSTLRPLGHTAPGHGPLDGLLGHHLNTTLAYGLFSLSSAKPGADVPPWFAATPADGETITARVHATVELMLDCGLAPSREAAASYLAKMVQGGVGVDGPPQIDWQSTAVACAPEAAAAFLRAVSAHGVRVIAGPLDGTNGFPAAPHVRDVWHPIAKALAAELAMTDVIDAHRAAAAVQSSEANRIDPSTARSRRVAV